MCVIYQENWWPFQTYWFSHPKLKEPLQIHLLLLVDIFRVKLYVKTQSHTNKMVSRRKILSRSRDELHSDIYYMAEDDDDDVWHSKDKLYRVRNYFLCLKNILSRSILLSHETCTNTTSQRKQNKHSIHTRKLK